MKKIPECCSEAHPLGASRNTMRVAQETPEWVSFICKECGSIQVRTLRRGRERARYSIEQRASSDLIRKYKNQVGKVRVFNA